MCYGVSGVSKHGAHSFLLMTHVLGMVLTVSEALGNYRIYTHTHTHTLTQITRLFAEEIVSSILKIQKFTQICMHACKHTKPTGFPSLCNPTRQDVPDSPVQYTSTQTHLSLPHISHTKSLKVSDPQSRWVEWLKNTH